MLLIFHRRNHLARIVIFTSLQTLDADLVHLVVALVAVDGVAARVRARFEFAPFLQFALYVAYFAMELVIASYQVYQLLYYVRIFLLLRLKFLVSQVNDVRVEEGFPFLPYFRVQVPHPRPFLLRMKVGHDAPPQPQDVRLQEANQVDEKVQDRANYVHAVVGLLRLRYAQVRVQFERRIDRQSFDRVFDLVEQFAHDAVFRV